jgi:glycosyltransferase involved in cell wall biosynthesis
MAAQPGTERLLAACLAAMNLGIVADEFFCQEVGRMGGFGWAARQVATFFNSRPELGVHVTFLAARPPDRWSAAKVHDTPIVFCDPAAAVLRAALAGCNPHLLLTLDYRTRYRPILDTLDRVPILVWVRDPKPPEIQARVRSLRLFRDCSQPHGIAPFTCRSLAPLRAARVQAGVPVLLATPAPSLASSVATAYGVEDVDCVFLPNIVDSLVGPVTKSETPRVIFLGRLDPIKRPWLFVELARSFPTVEFVMLGQAHFHGNGNWTAVDLPANVRLLGHIDGTLKDHIVSSAWVLVNTSIHEALPTSFLESLARETPILSFTNQEEVVSRFGIVVPWSGGDGMQGLTGLTAGLRRLLDDAPLRTTLGREGRRWVERTHNGTGFLQAFERLCARAGIHRGALPPTSWRAGAID